jgi:hypothetical protein
MAELVYQFSTSTAFASAIIRRLSHSEFSHIDLMLPGEGLLGVSGPDKSIKDVGGVLIRPFNAWPYKFPPKIARVQCSDDVVRKTIEFARSQIGKPFDNAALYHFLRDRAGLPVVGRDWRDPSQWFCSEYQLRCPEVGGLFPYPLITRKDVVSPNDCLIYFNPFMSPDNIREFIGGQNA